MTLMLPLLVLPPLLAGCAASIQPLAVALAGAGTSSAISHTLNGTAYRTFTAPLQEVEQATLETFTLMGIRLDGVERPEGGNELIRGSMTRREIEIELEPISAKTTRMRVEAKNNGFVYDGATATEIVLQAEKSLGVGDVMNSSYGGSRTRR
jgi:hypothetical protein